MAGTAGIAYPLIVNYAITGDVSGGVDEYTINRPCTLIDAFCCTNQGAIVCTLTIGKGASAITDAMSFNVADTTVIRASSLTTANWTFAAGDALRYTVTLNTIRGNVSVMLIPPVAYSTAIP